MALLTSKNTLPLDQIWQDHLSIRFPCAMYCHRFLYHLAKLSRWARHLTGISKVHSLDFLISSLIAFDLKAAMCPEGQRLPPKVQDWPRRYSGDSQGQIVTLLHCFCGVWFFCHRGPHFRLASLSRGTYAYWTLSWAFLVIIVFWVCWRPSAATLTNMFWAPALTGWEARKNSDWTGCAVQTSHRTWHAQRPALGRMGFSRDVGLILDVIML